MAIPVVQVKLSKRRLATLTRDERTLMILAGHTMNVVTTWLKMVGFSANREGDSHVEQVVQSGQTLVLLRAFYGSLVEANEWIRRPTSQALIGQSYLSHMPENSRDAYQELKRQFGQSGFLYQIRNNFSHHYPKTPALEKAFEGIPDDDDWSWYMSPSLSNSCWLACEAVVSRGVLDRAGKSDEVEALAEVVSRAVKIADLTTSFVMGLLQAMLDVHFDDLKDAELVLTVNEAPKADDFFIPFFMEGA